MAKWQKAGTSAKEAASGHISDAFALIGMVGALADGSVPVQKNCVDAMVRNPLIIPWILFHFQNSAHKA